MTAPTGSDPSTWADAWRHALTFLTVLRVDGPRTVDARTASRAMLLAPVAATPLGLLVGAIAWLATTAGAGNLVTGLLCVGALALGSRALHWDGLADTVDGLTASYSRERSLEVMRTGASGPAGVLSIVLVAGIQAAALAAIVVDEWGWLAAGLLVLASRSALTTACVRGVPAARPDGLGALHIGSVPALSVVASAAATIGVCTLAGQLVGTWWLGALAWPVALACLALLARRSVRRLGGLTGDVLGACVELSLAAVLVVVSL